MQFTDLKTQYTALKAEIDAGIQRVLDQIGRASCRERV